MKLSDFLKTAAPIVYIGFWVWFIILWLFYDLSKEEIAGWLVFNIMPWGTIISYIGAYVIALIGF